MKSARQSQAARQDIKEVAIHIGRDSGRKEVARKAVRGIIEKCDGIAKKSEFMTVGRLHPIAGEGVRIVPYERWVIFFRYTEEGIDVLRVADKRQDYLSWQLE